MMSLVNSPDPAVRAAVVQQDLANVLHPIVQHKALETKQMVVTGGEGSTVVDADGTIYLDAMAGLWCVNIGYGRTELAEVAAEQMRQLSYFPHTAMNVPAAGLAAKINGLMGGDYHTYFVNSGSEANEAGFKIARQYMKQEHPGEYRFKTIGRYFAYHGTTLATLDAGGMGERKAKFEPFSGNFVHVAPPYCYRCPFGLSYPSCGLACVKNIEATILGEGPETVAEVIVEPVMSGIGVAVPTRRIHARGRGPLPQIRHPPSCRRGHQRLRPNRQDVRPPALWGVARHRRHREGHLQRLPADRRHGRQKQRVQKLLRRSGRGPAGGAG